MARKRWIGQNKKKVWLKLEGLIKHLIRNLNMNENVNISNLFI